jgi:hypothetical protein
MSPLSNLTRRAVVLAALALGAMACGPEYNRTEITAEKGRNTLGGGVSKQRLDVPEGLVITAHIVAWNDDNEQMPLGVRSKDPSVVEVKGVVNDRNYAFVGLKEGTTEIELIADGDLVLTIPATVTKQPELP